MYSFELFPQGLLMLEGKWSIVGHSNSFLSFMKILIIMEITLQEFYRPFFTFHHKCNSHASLMKILKTKCHSRTSSVTTINSGQIVSHICCYIYLIKNTEDVIIKHIFLVWNNFNVFKTSTIHSVSMLFNNSRVRT